MKALTISQPYASLIASGEKWVENRTWETLHRGYLAIHAGKGTQYLDRKSLIESEYPTGVVLCRVRLVACLHLQSIRDGKLPREGFPDAGYTVEQFLAHEHAEGPFCWVLSDVRPYLEPIPARGKQGLWDWDEPDFAEFER